MFKSLLLSLCVIGAAWAEQAPVLVWGAKTEKIPSLQLINEEAFVGLVRPLLKNHMLVAFLEHDLSPETFNCRDAGDDQTCFKSLKNRRSQYYLRVANASQALGAIQTKHEDNVIDATGELIEPIVCKVGKIVSVAFEDDDGLTREEVLSAHDAAINKISMGMNCGNVKVAYLYISTPGPAPVTQTAHLSRHRRATITTSEDEHIYRFGNKFLFYYESLHLGADSVTLSNMVVSENATGDLTVTFDTSDQKKLVFDIVNGHDGYAYMKNVVFGGVAYRSLDINAPTSFSYYCSQLKLYPSKAGSPTVEAAPLNFTSLQFQAPFNAKTSADFAFGDPWHCVGFFTPGILGGLFVAILLIIIMFTAICWIMDINTMDRFDDPKGKTITINTTASD